MIPASADWITVPLDERALRAADGWSFDCDVQLTVAKRGEKAKHFAVMWRARVAAGGTSQGVLNG